MDDSERTMNVVLRAEELIAHRRNATLLHIEGRDTEANELDNVEWMFYQGLEDAVDQLLGGRRRD